jgi:hypothetical protein
MTTDSATVEYIISIATYSFDYLDSLVKVEDHSSECITQKARTHAVNI